MGRLLVSFAVTPYGGVWIEMRPMCGTQRQWTVTPYGGVWIEICLIDFTSHPCQSRLMEACGLK